MHDRPACMRPSVRVQVCQELIETSLNHPWQELHQEVRGTKTITTMQSHPCRDTVHRYGMHALPEAC